MAGFQGGPPLWRGLFDLFARGFELFSRGFELFSRGFELFSRGGPPSGGVLFWPGVRYIVEILGFWGSKRSFGGSKCQFFGSRGH